MLLDILESNCIGKNPTVMFCELSVGHRIRERRFLLDYIPEDSIGAELGVFTGLFSSVLANQPKIRKITFVDPWWLCYGDHFPNWGRYTCYGRLSTKLAYSIAKKRIDGSFLANREVVVSTSTDWLETQEDKSLDWAYLDSTHSYLGTLRELELLNSKIKDNGLILGDDWGVSGVNRAVTEFTDSSDFKINFCDKFSQWMMSRNKPFLKT